MYLLEKNILFTHVCDSRKAFIQASLITECIKRSINLKIANPYHVIGQKGILLSPK